LYPSFPTDLTSQVLNAAPRATVLVNGTLSDVSADIQLSSQGKNSFHGKAFDSSTDPEHDFWIHDAEMVFSIKAEDDSIVPCVRSCTNSLAYDVSMFREWLEKNGYHGDIDRNESWRESIPDPDRPMDPTARIDITHETLLHEFLWECVVDYKGLSYKTVPYVMNGTQQAQPVMQIKGVKTMENSGTHRISYGDRIYAYFRRRGDVVTPNIVSSINRNRYRLMTMAHRPTISALKLKQKYEKISRKTGLNPTWDDMDKILRVYDAMRDEQEKRFVGISLAAADKGEKFVILQD
jgi:hypothetical protein